MKTERLKMAAKLIACVAILVVGFSFGTASAASDPASSALLYTYYDVRSIADGGLGLSDNYFTVTNTDVNWVQAHVRVRTGDKSVELLDFDVLLSPKDVFQFDLYMAGNGGIEFASCDRHTLTNSGFTVDVNGCVVMNTATNPNLLSLIEKCQGVDEATALLATQKGYVEIIGEGKIAPSLTNVNKCLSWVSPATTQNIPGYTLYNITAAAPGNNCAVGDILAMDSVLEGKIYYATVDPADFSVQRLAYLNAEPLDNLLPAWGLAPYAALGVIVHADTYAAEQTRCGADNGCMAYVDAKIAPAPTNGADDLNICFYKNTITAANDVVNRFGGAASFGPTIADLSVRRDGTLATTATALNTLALGYSAFNGSADMSNWFGPLAVFKNHADTHYFYVPAPSDLDMAIKVAFIFPFQHFIAESDAIAITEVYDMEEGTTTVSLSKFISPGLPTASTPGQEAQIFSFSPPFPEGWVSFSPSATNGTCAVADADDVQCIGGAYLPGYTAAVFTSGAGALGASHMHYR